MNAMAAALRERIDAKTARVGILGMGYVGLPLARLFTVEGIATIGFDIDPSKVEMLNAGQSYIKHIEHRSIGEMTRSGQFEATSDFSRAVECDVLILCVPTPLTRYREPDLSFVERTAGSIAAHLKPGCLVILESTSYPGTTQEVLQPILAGSERQPGTDLFIAYSPEREDPGNVEFSTDRIPKVVGADDPDSLELALVLYDKVVSRTVAVSSTRAAEAVKITENVFRSVNIALVNELKVIYDAMGIDVWEVIDAAKTKPFGFMPFYPGPGLGGHCIPIDPFYLTWKAREHEIPTRFIELAGEINTRMPDYVVSKVAKALNERAGKAVSRSRILLVGLAYKKDVDDTRESPGLRLIAELQELGAEMDYYDPFVAEIPKTRAHPSLAGRRSVAWDPSKFGVYDLGLICTDHSGVDYAALVEAVPIIVDTRNATRDIADNRNRIVKA